MPRPHHPRFHELLGWSLFGVALGTVTGLVVTEWLGPVRRSVTPSGLPRFGSAGRRLTSGQTALEVRRAILADEALAELDLRVLGIAPGVVQVGGWVPDRATRARLARLVRSVDGVESLVNSILVHGEDDPPPRPTLQLSDRSA